VKHCDILGAAGRSPRRVQQAGTVRLRLFRGGREESVHDDRLENRLRRPQSLGSEPAAAWECLPA